MWYDERMQALEDVIRALRAEVVAALQEGQALPPRCRWEAQRVVATIDFAVVSTPGETGAPAPRFVVAGGGSGGHSLQIEFAPVRDTTASRPAQIPAQVPARSADHFSDLEAEAVVDALSRVFGAPGFDSSARATVFREALEPLSALALDGVIASLGEAADTGDLEVDRARHLVRRVVISGPGRMEEGTVALQELFHRHSAPDLLGQIAKRWRTQLDWLG